MRKTNNKQTKKGNAFFPPLLRALSEHEVFSFGGGLRVQTPQ